VVIARIDCPQLAGGKRPFLEFVRDFAGIGKCCQPFFNTSGKIRQDETPQHPKGKNA
jgi:hypothetical protein